MSIVVPDRVGQWSKILASIRMVAILPRPVAVVLAMYAITFADLVEVGILAGRLHVYMLQVVRHVVVDFVRPISFMDPAPLEVQAEVRVSDLWPVADVVRLVQYRQLGAFTLRPVVYTERIHARRDPDQRVGLAPIICSI